MKSFWEEFERIEKEYLTEAENLATTEPDRAYEIAKSVFDFYADMDREMIFENIICEYPKLSDVWESVCELNEMD